MKATASLGNDHPVVISSVVESGAALHPESHGSSNQVYPSDQAMLMSIFSPRLLNWHEVHDLTHAVRRKEPGDQDIRLRPVQLFMSNSIGNRGDGEVASLFVIQNCTEHAG
jgi:hypothetical protein